MKKLIMLTALVLAAFHPTFAAEVTDADENWHDMGRYGRMAYEWFYFDIHSPDGNNIVIAFLGPNPFDVDKGSLIKGIRKHVGVLVQAVTPDGRNIEIADYTRKNDISFTEKPFSLRINNSLLTMEKNAQGLREYKIKLDARDYRTGQAVRGNFTFTAKMQGWKQQEGFVYLDKKSPTKNFHKWFATVPKAEVSGSFEVSAVSNSAAHSAEVAKASGYHDHNLGTLAISETTDGWYWGRAQIGDKTIVYASVFGKSKPAFLGDFTYKKNPPSTMMFMATENEVLIDSDKMVLNDFGTANGKILENGMAVPKNYSMKVPGLKSDVYQFEVTPERSLSVSTPYYSRQDGQITMLNLSDCGPEKQCHPQSSPILISEKIDYPRFLNLVLGLPKPLRK